MFSKIKPFLPFVGAFIIYLNDYLIPSDNIFSLTPVYPIVVAGFLAIYVLRYFNARRDPAKYKKFVDAAFRTFVTMMLLVAWDIATYRTAALPLPFFPWIDRILNVFIADWSVLIISVLYSLRLLILGYIIGGAVGIMMGVWIGWSSKASFWIFPALRIIGPIPAVAWIPIVLMLAPTTLAGSVFLIALAVWFPTALMTMSGVSGVRNAYLEVARTLGSSQRSLIMQVALPAALPSVFLGMFQGIGVACVTLISAEMIGVKAGIGWYISSATGWMEYDKVFAGIILILITFTLVITLIFKVRDRFLSWQKGVIKW